MQNKEALPFLVERLEDESEHVMVRHEAAEAIGAIGCLSTKIILEKWGSSFGDHSPQCLSN